MIEKKPLDKSDKPKRFIVTVADAESGAIQHEVTSDVVIVGVIQRTDKDDAFWCLYQGNIQGLNNLLSYIVFVVTGFINKTVKELKVISTPKNDIPDKNIN